MFIYVYISFLSYICIVNTWWYYHFFLFWLNNLHYFFLLKIDYIYAFQYVLQIFVTDDEHYISVTRNVQIVYNIDVYR